jgi:uncharacterized membrane protein YgcG
MTSYQRQWQWHFTAADWTAANPVLFAGELGLEMDTLQWKFGDGVTAWNSLSYAGGSGGGGGGGGGGTGVYNFDDGTASATTTAYDLEEGGA